MTRSLMRRPAALRRPLLALPLIGSLLLTLALTGLPAGLASAAPTPQAPSAQAQDLGSWSVEPLGGRRWQLTWTSPSLLPIRSDRPAIVSRSGQPVTAPMTPPDRRTVSAVVTSRTRPTPADFDVVLSGDRLDATGDDATAGRSTGSRERRTAREVEQLAADPGVPGSFPVTTSDYTLPSVPFPGFDEPIEMIGHVVEPTAAAATGPRPLVLFLHGRHEYCYDGNDDTWPCQAPGKEIPSQLGYDYAQRLLASQGYATVSIRVNGINAQDWQAEDGGAAARSLIVQRHLDQWATIAGEHQVDLSRVVLVGHSRGGEGVNRASIDIPLSAPYRIVGQVLIAPTDFAEQTAPYVPTVTLLPYCDGDVYDLQGQTFTDASRDLDADDTSLKSSVLVMGANHNFFNTEWTPGLSAAPSSDDWGGPEDELCGTETPERLTAAQQRSVGQAYVTGAVRLFADDDQQFLPMFDGSAVTVPSIGSATVYSHTIGAGPDVRRPRLDADPSPTAAGARGSICTGQTSYELDPSRCGSGLSDFVTPHWNFEGDEAPARDFFQLSWTASGQSGGLLLDEPLDLRSRQLDLRTIVDPRPGETRFRVRITDSAGAGATLTPIGGSLIPALPAADFVTKLWAQTVRVDPSTATGVDLADVVRVDLIGDSDSGRVWIADLAAHNETLAPVPNRRAPVISLGEAKVTEGDGDGWAIAEVPYSVTGTASRPARFKVITTGDKEGSLRRLTVDIAPGQTSGTIPVAYPTNDIDDQTSVTVITGWATRNAITSDYFGSLTVTDDDPRPTIKATRVDQTIKEGESARWKVTLSAPTGYPIEVAGKVARGASHRLTGYDVSKSWLRRHASGQQRSSTLYRLETRVYGVIEPGSRTVVLSIPVRKDGKKEGRESVALRVSTLGQAKTTTIYVAKSR